MTSPRGLVLGIGNPLRSDDGVGWRVVERLRSELPDTVELLAAHQLTPEHATKFGRVQRVAFVDAAVDDQPGRIAARPVDPQITFPDLGHGMDAAHVLGIASWLELQLPQAMLFTVGAKCFDHGEKLSPEVEAALPALCARVAAWIQDAG